MKKNNFKGSLILCTAALIWGLAFVAQSSAADKIGSFTFNFARSIIGSIFLYLFIKIRDFKAKTPFIPKNKTDKFMLFKGSFFCAIALVFATNFQQFGLAVYPKGVASEARGGFITALYVILVPISSVFFGKKINLSVLLGVIVALIGIYMLCLSGGISGIYLGDVLLFLCAIAFTIHIMVIDNFSTNVDCIKLSCLQFAISGIISGILALVFEQIDLHSILNAIIPILYLGIMSSGVAYTLQIVGQKYAEPTVASLSMSLESVFAALGGWLIVGNYLTAREITGCALVFIAIVVAQMPELHIKRTT